jgi:hypothetical protein
MFTNAGTANSTCQSNLGFDSINPNRSNEPEYAYSPFGASPNQSHEYMRLLSELVTTASPILIGGCASASDGSSSDANVRPNSLRMSLSLLLGFSKPHTSRAGLSDVVSAWVFSDTSRTKLQATRRTCPPKSRYDKYVATF